MKKIKLALVALAFVTGIGGAMASTSHASLGQCPGNVAPANCTGGSTECCFILVNGQQQIVDKP
ncbi:MAG: hypothetical protein ACTHJ0_08820 [Flavipsychrobacter sp.]